MQDVRERIKQATSSPANDAAAKPLLPIHRPRLSTFDALSQPHARALRPVTDPDRRLQASPSPPGIGPACLGRAAKVRLDAFRLFLSSSRPPRLQSKHPHVGGEEGNLSSLTHENVLRVMQLPPHTCFSHLRTLVASIAPAPARITRPRPLPRSPLDYYLPSAALSRPSILSPRMLPSLASGGSSPAKDSRTLTRLLTVLWMR